MSSTIRKPASVRPEIARLQANIEKVIKGKSEVVRNALICVLARGHLLLEDVPGVGKTTLAHCIARSLNLSFSRIQFTSDMLPSDILGVTIFDQGRREFEFKPGPLFAHVVLADEINRTTPKTQSALLEAMNSAQVSIEKRTYDLPRPFIVLATQNPIEFHGTFPLPKSQMDRFMMRIHLGYPDLADEITVLREHKTPGDIEELEPVISGEEMLALQGDVDRVSVDDALLEYLARIVQMTREYPSVLLGISTRGALALRRSAQALAFFEGRDYCIPDDIKEMVHPVLAHRLLIQDGYDSASMLYRHERRVLDEILTRVTVPV